jgi:putative heme transporter
LVSWMERIGIRRGLGSGIVVLGGLALVVTMLAFAGQQVASGANDLATQVSDGLGEVKNWLQTGPFHVSDRQINDYIQKAQDSLSKKAQSGAFLSQVTNIGSALTHILAGLFLVLFSTYFFLADGERIWSWFVRIAPRAARARVDSSGRVAWISLTQFIRATVIVAVTDAIGVMIAASILQVQFVLAIGVLVFLGAFVPIVGAFVTGVVAVLVALVSKGFVSALIMLGIVIAVQQLEAHVLQPFLLGRAVEVHPLAVILGIGAGVLVAGIIGALFAVPLVAVGHVVAEYLREQPPEPEQGSPPTDPGTQTPAEDADQAKDEAGPLADAPVPDRR